MCIMRMKQCSPPAAFKQRLYREPMRRVCLFMADRIVGISNHTLDKFLAGRARRPERDSVHYYGVDPTPFENVAADRAGFRRQWDLPQDACILLFGGRLVPEKNPVFVGGRLGQSALHRPPGCSGFRWALDLRRLEVLARARELGVENSVRLLGWRNDMPEIMSCSDWFILPHPEHPVEGFGVAIVEAQLAGLRMLLSRGIPDDRSYQRPVFVGSHSPTGLRCGRRPRWNFCAIRYRHGPPRWLRSANRR